MIRIATPAVILALAGTLWALRSDAQDGDKWQPYQFKGNERYEYKFVTAAEGDAPKKEVGYILDIRKKGEDEFDVTWSIKAPVKKAEAGERLVFGMMGEFAPAWILMNPMWGAFLQQVDLKEGEKVSLFGMGVIKVGAKETVGGRSGFACQYLAPDKDKKDVLTLECTIDRELALPIKSVSYEDGKEKARAELVSYKKD